MDKIYKKHKNTKNKYIYEIILQWYLINHHMRTMALIQVPMSESSKPVINFVKKYNIPYKTYNDTEARVNIVIYNKKKFDINTFDKLSTKQFGKLLGEFYTCATNNFYKHDHRVVILFNQVEIFAQMCKESTIKLKFDHFYKIYLKLNKIFFKLDPNISGKLEFYSVPPQQ